jgi:hypothetical protein
MSLERLTYKTMGQLANGFGEAVIDAALERMIADLDDRGEDEKERSVTIKVTSKKADNGMVVSWLTAAVTLPPLRTPGTIGEAVKKNGRAQLLFQTQNPERPDQPTFPALEDGEVSDAE